MPVSRVRQNSKVWTRDVEGKRVHERLEARRDVTHRVAKIPLLWAAIAGHDTYSNET